MVDADRQKELFEFEKPKRKTLLKFGGLLFPKSDFKITLALEKLVFASIAMVLMMVIVYALGVERGRRLVPRTRVEPIKADVREEATSTIAPHEVKVAMPEKSADPKPFTIVAVTFTREVPAQAEANRLKKAGLEAFVVDSEPYFLVCVGSYADKEDAESKKALARVKQIYKDAYFKLR